MTFYSSSPAVRTRSVTPMSPRITDMMPGIADHTVGNHLGKSATMGHAKAYYNTARNQLYSRYSHSDWENSNRSNFSLSEREKSLAERLRADAWRTVKSTDQRTRNRQASNTKKLAERCTDITFWKSELINEIRAMENETDNLQEHKRVLERAYHDTRSPLSIAEECLLQREKRRHIDSVHDDVETSLNREVSTIKRCQDKMRRLIEKASIQLKMNRSAYHACDMDSKDKFHAQLLDDKMMSLMNSSAGIGFHPGIEGVDNTMNRAAHHACDLDSKDKHHSQNLDDRMHGLRNSSAGLGFHPGIEGVDNTITIPYSWVKFTQENIARSQKERESSERLRGEIDALLRACANEMWSQFNSVNNNFNTRIQEGNDAKNKLQAHLSRTNNEIRDMERAIDLLKKAIHDKEGPMKVAQTRLDERTRRINVELCNDPSMKGLQTEVHEIRESVRMLKDKLRQAENALVRLLKTKSTLEHDIGVKENSLQIDSKYCMGMRKNMPMDPKVGPIFSMPMVSY